MVLSRISVIAGDILTTIDHMLSKYTQSKSFPQQDLLFVAVLIDTCTQLAAIDFPLIKPVIHQLYITISGVISIFTKCYEKQSSDAYHAFFQDILVPYASLVQTILEHAQPKQANALLVQLLI